MKQYETYKNSEFEWNGDIPSHWDVLKIKFLGDLYGGLTGKKGDDFNQDDNPNNKPYIPFTNIFNNTYISKNHFHYVVLNEDENQNRVKKYDLFFLMSSENYEDLGKSSILIEDVDELYLNSFCKGYRVVKSEIDPLFLNYQLLGDFHRKMLSIEGRGFTRINLRQDKLNDLKMFVPPIHEQQQIVNYLDQKTTQIDTLIETTQKKIELLKEQRTTLINQVVTKGLNPNVEMKDSGVDWIGEIPKHWEITSLKYLVGNNELTLGNDTPSDYELDYIEISDVNSDGVITGKTHYKFEDSPSRCRRILRKGDVFISTVRTYLKSIGIVEDDVENVICSTGFCVLTPNPNCDSKFLFYMLRTQWFLSDIISKSVGVSYPSIQNDKLMGTKVLGIPFEEQILIVEYINKMTQTIDTTINKEQKRIELLTEYRKTLISDVVTGKIKVTTNE